MILTLNAGSSSLKAGCYTADLAPLASVVIERIGGAAHLSLRGDHELARAIEAPDHAAALTELFAALTEVFPAQTVSRVGHRIVHGGPDRDAPCRVDTALLTELAEYAPLAPLHQPHNIAGLRAAITAFPEALQVAVFDTAFHRSQPWVNQTYALPERYFAQGLRRYGFHGISYQFIAEDLAKRAPDLAKGRVIALHLGNGASACALKNGRSVATTMGFSPLDGLAMGTRSGQIDPGVLLYLIDHDGMSSAEVADLLYRRSGLLGLSGLSNDMRTLEEAETLSARRAIDYFCARARREIGSLAAALEGLDGIVFTGGIGEHSAFVRAQICAGLGWLGAQIDPQANATVRAGEIGAGALKLWVLPTNEEDVIAQATVAA